MYVKIYAHAVNQTNKIKEIVQVYVQGNFDGFGYFDNDGISISIRVNKECNLEKARNFPDGFLFFSHHLELELAENYSDAVGLISGLLVEFWKNELPSVAACDFEEELPERGGYKSNKTPWPTF